MKRLLRKVKRGLWFLRRPYFGALREIVSPQTSIISNNCFGGRISQDLGYAYNSPTAGLYFFYPDYINFLRNLKGYINGELHFREQSKYPEGRCQQAATPWKYPIGYIVCNGVEVEIEFLHYHSQQEAREKWERRCKRINFDNLFVVGTDLDLCTEGDILNFLQLSFQNKIFFSAHPYDIKSDDFIFVKEMQKYGKMNVYEKAHILYKYLCKKKMK